MRPVARFSSFDVAKDYALRLPKILLVGLGEDGLWWVVRPVDAKRFDFPTVSLIN